ncbi:hypothetical protein [Streptomyces sp. NRRL S-495]|uniref:hypothetical protein n=1 Tax=Streptomyces sp. NRRL S-495 TaxID=1609133 RepID=UPI0005F97740|nr:hypothetical protein [Streptomyces sp. NRRL S-495]KJY27477.1 hypothetical protein VR45_34795 [Streptomyces sp. NRRL S-495]
MLDTIDAVMAALRDNDARPYGRQRTVTAEELVDAADQFEDTGLRAMALLELMEAYEYDGERSKAPVVFARVLRLWDTDPDSFGEWATQQVFWRFKWVATSLLGTPDVPLASVRRWHGEMRDRYRAAGHGLQPYYAQRFHLAAHIGEDVQDAYELWAARPRTELSDCHACEVRAAASHLVRQGDDAAALEAWRPVLSGESTCAEEPHVSHAQALLPLLRQGRLDEARSSHLVGYRFARGKSGLVRSVGQHIEFCALSGNEPRGLEILAENRDLFGVTGDPSGRLDFLTGVEVLIAGLARAGHGALTVSGPPGASWTVDTLLAHLRTEADALAARFDARNGTAAVGSRRRDRLARRPLLAEPLALGVRASAAPELAAVPVVPAVPVREAEPEPEDFAALVLRARELQLLGHPDADRLWRRIDERFTAEGEAAVTGAADADDRVGTAGQLRAELAERRAHAALDREDWKEGAAELRGAGDLFEREGLAGRALAARTRALVAVLVGDGSEGGSDDGDGGDSGDGSESGGADAAGTARAVDWAALDAALARAEELAAAPGGPALADDDYLVVLQCRAYAAHHELVLALPEPPEEPPAEQAGRFARTVTAYREAAAARGSVRRLTVARQYAADVAARQGRIAEAAEELRTVIAELEQAGQPWHTPRAYGLLGQALLQNGEQAEAVEVLHRALAAAARWADESYPFAATYLMAGHASAHLGDTGAAIRALSEAAGRFDRKGPAAAGDAARTRLQLADLLSSADRTADAVAVLESVLADAAAAGPDDRLFAQARLDLARGLYTLDEYRDAAEEYLRLATLLEGWTEDLHLRTMVAAEAAVALALADRWEAAHAARSRALAAQEQWPQTGPVSAMLRQFARLLVQREGADGLEQALARLAEADAVRERAERAEPEADAWYLRASVHYERARAYAVADRYEEALTEADLAITAYEAGGERAETPRAEAVRLAALIEGTDLGRTAAARERLAAAVERCRGYGLEEAAEILADLRERLAD